jgi:hypothetical protein
MAALLLVVPVTAQEQRGSIEGTVVDTSGGVLPGVTVEARSEAGAVVTTTTDGQGVFRFPALAPGMYDVTATLGGFAPRRFERVEVLLGQIKRLDFSLTVAGVAEEVMVTAESPLVDVKQSARATSLRGEQVELLPKGRDFSTIVTQAAGANNEVRLGGISIDGASASENRYIVDGIETTNLQDGSSSQTIIADFVEEVQVKSSGYTAEYGGATGGVVNVLTKSGSNAFRGNALFYWTGDALEAGHYGFSEFGGSTGAAPSAIGGRDTLRLNPASGAAEYVGYPEDSFNRVEPGFSIGGPLVADRMWFFAAYQPTIVDTERTVTLLTTNNTITEDQSDTRHYFTANQTSQISDKLRTRLAFNNSWRRRDGLLPALDGQDPEGTSYTPIATWPTWSLSGQADWIARSDLYFGFRAGYYYADYYDQNIANEPRFWFNPVGNIGFVGTDGVPVPPELQHGAGFSSVPTNWSTTFDKQKRFYAQADGTWYANLAGQHTFKGGVQIDNLGNEVLDGELRPRVTIRWGGNLATGKPFTKGPFGYYSVRSNGVNPQQGFITEGDVSTTNVGLFFQDAWTINNRLTINAGVRTERERVPAYAAGEGIPSYGVEFDFQDKLAPRLGFAYDIMGDGRWKTYASWGIFYDIFKYELPRGSFGGDKWLEYYYTLDTPDWSGLIGPNCPPACGGTLIRGPVDFRHPSFGSDAIEPDLKPMKMQEAAVGLEHQLSAVTALSVRYVHKQIDRAIEDTGSLDDQGNEIYIIANPGEGLTKSAWPGVALPKPQRDYDAVEFAFDKRYADNWFLRTSYLWSRLYGNYSGLSQGDENGRMSPNVGRLYDYPAMMFDENGKPVFGHLPSDRPHQFKAQGIYSFNFGTSVGLNLYLASGVPVTRELGIYPPNTLPVQYRGRMSDGRTDVFSQTDLYVQHEFKLAGDRRLQISLNVLNLFDQAAAVGKWSTYELTGSGIVPDEEAMYAGQADFDQLIAEQGVPQDPRFLKDSFFQAPISARFGVKFIF